MKLDVIMNEMNEKGTYTGNLDFDMLALSSYSTNKKKLIFIDDINYITDKVIENNNNVILTTNEIASKGLFSSFCICDHPRIIFFKIHNYLSCNVNYKRKQFNTLIGNNCSISPLSHISKTNVKIGDNVTIEEFVSIKENTVIGNNSIIRAGTIIGGEGFEFKRNGNEVMSVKHIGGVVIGENVEIQYNTVIDKALYPWDNTIIGDYSKIDNLVHIAHAVKMKQRALVVANSLICGRTELENDVWIGASATVINGVTIGKNSRVNIGAVVIESVCDNESVTGFIRNLKRIE